MVRKKKTTAKKSNMSGSIDKAFSKARDNEVEMPSGGDMPPGVEGGTAELTDIKIGTYKKGDNKGKKFFMAQGVCLTPKSCIDPRTNSKVNVQGLRTSIGPEPICDTPKAKGKRKTLQDHADWIINQFKLLGVDTSECEGLSDLESYCELLMEEPPVFGFRTWIGQATKAFPNPRVNHVWSGLVDVEAEDEEEIDEEEDDEEDDEEEEDEDFEEDDDEEEEDDDEEEEDDDEEEDDEDEDDEEEEDEEGDDEEFDPESASLSELGEVADDDSDEDTSDLAIEKLTELAEEAGLDVNDYGDWASLATALEEAGAEPPEKEEVYGFKPPKARKARQCEVKSVNKRKKTVTLKDLDNDKTYQNVPWSKLIADE